MQVQFHHWLCDIQYLTYPNGRTAIQLVDAEDQSPIAVATVNIPEAPLKENQVLIKDYSENQGILDVLVKAGIVKDLNQWVPSGHITADVCELLEQEKTAFPVDQGELYGLSQQ